jgi:phosphatidylserine decarboxylase
VFPFSLPPLAIGGVAQGSDNAKQFNKEGEAAGSLKMVKDAYPILVGVGATALLLVGLGWLYAPLWVFGGIGLAAAGFVAYFFRDPDRAVPEDTELVVSPADGRVVVVEGMEAGTLVSIFLSVFDVHVNRAPVAGKIEAIEYRRGRFLVATKRRASVENEQNILTFSSPAGPVVCKQIAGLIARRIVCWVKPGAEVSRGERFGLIKFGSRVDLLLPAGVEVTVRRGEKVKGGESVIGRIKS